MALYLILSSAPSPFVLSAVEAREAGGGTCGTSFDFAQDERVVWGEDDNLNLDLA
jgi:hypothetical protein